LSFKEDVVLEVAADESSALVAPLGCSSDMPPVMLGRCALLLVKTPLPLSVDVLSGVFSAKEGGSCTVVLLSPLNLVSLRRVLLVSEPAASVSERLSLDVRLDDARLVMDVLLGTWSSIAGEGSVEGGDALANTGLS
jgi:hypothetical protein